MLRNILKRFFRVIAYYVKKNLMQDNNLLMGFFFGICISQLYNFRYEIEILMPHIIYNKMVIENEFTPVVLQMNETERNTTLADQLYNDVKVLCWVMTNPDNHNDKAKHVKNTWGKRCNKLLLMSTETDEKLETIALPVGEGRNQLWNKTKEAFKYIYKNHLNEYDWFLKADDDTYVVVENLRYMLYQYDPNSPIYFGCKFRPLTNKVYMSGGAGYVLSREAVRRYMEYGGKFPKYCHSNKSGDEDIKIGRCMKSVGVIFGNSRDSHKHGRFFPLSPEYHLVNNKQISQWYWHFIKFDNKKDCCSEYAISFHYIRPIEMYVLDYLIYHLKPFGIQITENLPQKINKSNLTKLRVDSIK